MLLQPGARTLGWVKDPYDANDHDAVKMLATGRMSVPQAADNHDLVEVLDQGGLGSCTANGTAQAIRAAEIVEQVEESVAKGMDEGIAIALAQSNTPFLSRLFAYFLARAWEGMQKIDAGTYIRLIFASLNKYGFCAEHFWPYSDDTDPKTGRFARMPDAEAFRQAYDQRDSVVNKEAGLISYSRISATGNARVDQIKLAVSKRYLIVFGTLVTNRFCTDLDLSSYHGRPIDPPKDGLDIAGGHAMCVGGYDEHGCKIVNSWGTGFGDGGWCTFSWDYMMWPETTDLWIVKRAPLLQKAA